MDQKEATLEAQSQINKTKFLSIAVLIKMFHLLSAHSMPGMIPPYLGLSEYLICL